MNRIAVFARPPVAGKVKTRLSPALTPALAVALYSGLLADTLDTVRACAADERTLWWSEAPEGAPAPEGFDVRVQPGDDLGVRLAAAFDAMLAGPGDRAVVIGSDLPALSAARLDEAFAALSDHDLVLGPAVDGGYWLVGLSRRARAVFEGIAWGTGEVFAQTVRAATRAGLRVRTLATLADVDTPADLVRLASGVACGTAALGRHARAALREMGLLPD